MRAESNSEYVTTDYLPNEPAPLHGESDRQVDALCERHQRLAAMGEMAAALAHQLRTPLAAGLLYVTTAIDSNTDEATRRDLLLRATECLGDLEQLIDDMLRFARGAGSASHTLSANSLLASVTAAIAPLLTERQSFDVCSAYGDWTIEANPESLSGALINLVRNGLEHGGPCARVTLSLEGDPQTARFTVSDNGPGVDPVIANRIFEPFFSTRNDGTGLGLAVVRAVAQAHAGEVRLAPSQTNGATFVFAIPGSAEPHSDSAESAS